MKKISIKYLLPLLGLLAAAALLSGCNAKDAKHGALPSVSPSASATAGAKTPSATASAAPSETANASLSPSVSPSETGAAGIEGFIEGGIVDPEDAPKLTALLKEKAEYADMAIQSITYKLREGRQAYYVVLQGAGDASKPLYVYADGTIEEAEPQD